MESKKRYWLRGVIGGVVGFFIFAFIAWYMLVRANEYTDCRNPLSGGMAPCFSENYFEMILNAPTYSILTLVVFILLGSIVGWFYGKVKNRKS